MPFKPCSDELVVVSYLADPRQELHAAEINIIMHPEYSGLHFSLTTPCPVKIQIRDFCREQAQH